MRTSRLLLLAIAVLGTAAGMAHYAKPLTGNSLRQRMAEIRPATNGSEVSCRDLAAMKPLVLLALGQSNAGNHGETATPANEPVFVIADDKCLKTMEPLPGATGNGGSIWAQLPRHLKAQGLPMRPVVLTILAVDATTIGEWTDAQSPLANLLVSRIAMMKRLSLSPDAILWQQGESDARKATPRDEYVEGLKKLARLLDRAGTDAPVILAQSTLCQGPPSEAIRQAIETAPAFDRRFHTGPDTDILAGEHYRIGCHMTSAGLESAARMWASAIAREIGFSESGRPRENGPATAPRHEE